ncbi:MAG: hypothetical protein ACOYOH_07190 [Paracraurococcus sp.]
MAAPSVAIGHLATRVRAPDAEAAMLAGRLVGAAAGRLGAAIDAALPRALAAAGLAEDAVVAIPRLALRLRLEGEVTEAELGAAWAEALAAAIAAAVPVARSEDGVAVFADAWGAEESLLRAAAAGQPLPWWAEAAGLDPGQPGVAARLLARWIARDAARAMRRMAALLARLPAVATLLTEAEAAALARAALAALRAVAGAAAQPGAPAAGLPVDGAVALPDNAAIGAMLPRLTAPVRAAIGGLPPGLRAPWIAAAILTEAPSWSAGLPALLPGLAHLSDTAWRDAAATPPAPGRQAREVPTLPAARPVAAGTTAADAVGSPIPGAEDSPQTTEVTGGGLLLLLRPLATLQPEWLTLGDGLPDRLLALGLLVLQRLAAPLPPAARRAALERDRPLLAVFAGAPPPEGPLEEASISPALALEAEAALARLLAAAPDGVAHAPGALRLAFGRDPFAGDPSTDALCRLVLRPGRLRLAEALAEIIWPLGFADPALRRAGWDIDPGWLPWLGRRIGFRYEGGA